MSTPVPRPIFVDNFSAFAPWCNSVSVDVGCLLTVGNECSECSVGGNAVLSETADASATESSNVPTLDSGSSSNQSMAGCNFVVSVDIDGSIVYERMFSECGIAEGLVGISKF